MKKHRKPDRAPERYRNDKPPRASLPSPNTHAGVMAHIHGKKGFYSRKVFIDDKPYALAGMFYNVQGIVKSYYVAEQYAGSPLFVWDKQSQQWYLSKNADQHPCCPDKSATQLSDYELRYLTEHGLMDLMEAKVNGYFNTPWTVVFNSNGTFRIV